MAIPIKIECDCGQRYAFEVEPLNGRVPAPVICPACGADGTNAANDALAKSLAKPIASTGAPVSPPLTRNDPATATTGHSPMRISLARAPASTAAHASSAGPALDRRTVASLLPGQTSRTQAQHEARAKMLWGDSPLQVTAYLLSQGFGRDEASELVQEFLRERMQTIRFKGIKYISIGAAFISIPALSAVSYWLNNRLPHSRIIGVLGFLGLVGAWFLVKGIGLLISPKSQSGNAAEEEEADAFFD